MRRPLAIVVSAMGIGIGVLSAPSHTAAQPKGGFDASKVALPKTRCLRMGMVPFPYAMTIEAIKASYDTVWKHCDLISHRLDDGVPWPEALAGEAYPKKVEDSLNGRVAWTKKDLAVFVSCSPLASGRKGLAKCWGSNDPAATARWKRKPLDHKDVIKAYVSYCGEVIKRLKPDYFAYGISVNELAEKSPKSLPAFKRFAREVYTQLKWAHPKLPVFLTFSLGKSNAKENLQRLRAIRTLIVYSDMLAVSVFPYLVDPTFGDPRRLPADWLAQALAVKGKRPFAVSLTAMPAEPLVLKTPKLRVPASPLSQAGYVHRLCKDANRMGAVFVVWQVPIDYDELWEMLRKTGAPEVFKIWRDTGLYDGKRVPRPALRMWDAWRALPLKPRPGAPVPAKKRP